MKLERCWVADFETTTDPKDCRVWAYSLCNVANPETFYYGNSMEDFFEWLELRDAHANNIWFHNLKFDGYFILCYLLSHGFKWIEKPAYKEDKTFTTLITDQGQYYMITVYFSVVKNKIHKVTFYDSLKIFPNFSVENIAKGFNLPIRKLEIDYRKKRPIGWQLTPEEIDYIRNDVEIVARALKVMFEQGHTKITIASDAMSDYKHRIVGFRRKFPLLPGEIDKDIRQAYRGGFTYVNDTWQGKLVGKGKTLDVNSLYPFVLKTMPMPFSAPEPFEGKYEEDIVYPLYVQAISCAFELKPNKIPTIQLKNNLSFRANEYLKSSNGKMVDLVLTNIDLRLFFEHYNVYHPIYNGGWKFRSASGLFDDYINHWIEQKIKAGKEGNAPMRQISKLLLNSLYGRFGISGQSKQKIPVIDPNGNLGFTTEQEEDRKTCYIPVAVFTTSYGREKTIRTSQAIKDYTLKKYGEDRYFYSDTDSIHANVSDEDLEELKDLIKVDPYELGAWDIEVPLFTRAMYIRQKCYIEEIDGKVNVTVAGLPKYLAPLINFDNFKKGFSTGNLTLKDMKRMAKENGATDEEIEKIHHKLTYHYVKGGVILEDTDFTIK